MAKRTNLISFGNYTNDMTAELKFKMENKKQNNMVQNITTRKI